MTIEQAQAEAHRTNKLHIEAVKRFQELVKATEEEIKQAQEFVFADACFGDLHEAGADCDQAVAEEVLIIRKFGLDEQESGYSDQEASEAILAMRNRVTT